MLSISNIAWVSMFDQVVDPIVDHVASLLETEDAMTNCKYLCLVGGFSCSPYFKHKMRSTFGENSKYKLQLIVPQRPILAVVTGAAYFGITENYIESRKLQKTYGFVRTMKLSEAREVGVPASHIEENTLSVPWDDAEAKYVRNCFEVMVHKKQEIRTGEVIENHYGRYSRKQSEVAFFRRGRC